MGSRTIISRVERVERTMFGAEAARLQRLLRDHVTPRPELDAAAQALNETIIAETGLRLPDDLAELQRRCRDVPGFAERFAEQCEPLDGQWLDEVVRLMGYRHREDLLPILAYSQGNAG